MPRRCIWPIPPTRHKEKTMNKQSVKRMVSGSALLSALLVMAGCSLAPTYVIPTAPVPAAFKETMHPEAEAATLSPDGLWKKAEPSEALARGAWWTVFGDATLDQL